MADSDSQPDAAAQWAQWSQMVQQQQQQQQQQTGGATAEGAQQTAQQQQLAYLYQQQMAMAQMMVGVDMVEMNARRRICGRCVALRVVRCSP